LFCTYLVMASSNIQLFHNKSNGYDF